MTAFLFGSIGTLADTSELQREAFNEAFRQHDLDWDWSRSQYRELLSSSGGAQRVADYAERRGQSVDAVAVHRTKSEIFQRRLAEGGVEARPGVAETIDQAREHGDTLALVTTTSPDNVAALRSALGGQVDLDAFALIVTADDVDAPKPAPDAYRHAVKSLGTAAEACVCIEDNVGGVRAAGEAGLPVVAFPGENNADHDFQQADRRVSELSYAELRPLAEN